MLTSTKLTTGMHPYVIIQGSQLWLVTIPFVGEGEKKGSPEQRRRGYVDSLGGSTEVQGNFRFLTLSMCTLSSEVVTK